jgi:hypothetical protein
MTDTPSRNAVGDDIDEIADEGFTAETNEVARSNR